MITEGYLVRHYQGAAGARDAALLDVAQDHLLMYLHSAGLFDRGLVWHWMPVRCRWCRGLWLPLRHGPARG